MSSSRWSKEDLESVFDEFLKTSEDDSEKIKQLLKSRSPASSKVSNDASLWWDKDTSEDSLQKGSGKSFLKTKDSTKPSIKSKSNTVSSNGTKEKHTVSKTSFQNKQEASPRKPGSRDMQKTKRQPQPQPGKTRGTKSKTDTSMSKDSLDDISERSEEADFRDHLHVKPSAIVTMNDSSIDTSASYEGAQSSRHKDNVGFDTLEELADKEQFFQSLENNHDGTVDYGRLNQELSQTGGTRADHSALSGLHGDEGTLAGNLNSDILHSSPQKASMLSRVALLDSVESTLNTTPSPKMPNSKETTHEPMFSLHDSSRNPLASDFMGTNTSKDMEDLQKVLKEAEETPTIYGEDSRPSTGRAINQTTITMQTKKDVDRSIGDILREMDAIEQRGRDIESRSEDIQLRSNYNTPRSPHSQGFSHKHPKDNLSGFDHSHTEDTEEYQPITEVPMKERRQTESRSSSRDRVTSTPYSQSEKTHSSRSRFSHVHSSGYGRPTSPPAKKSSHPNRPVGKSPPKSTSLKSSPDVDGKDLSRMEKLKTNIHRGITNSQSHDQQLTGKFDHIRADWTNHDLYDYEKGPLLLEQLRELMEQLNNERMLKSKLQDEVTSQEARFSLQLSSQKEKYEEEVYALKQENFVLSAKLKELQGDKNVASTKGNGATVQGNADDAEDSVTSKLKQEIREQENLLSGYQAENKRLYEEIKSVQRQFKATETSMFKENQRLTTELSNVKQELDLKSTELQNKGIITSVAVQQQIAAGNAEAAIGANRVAHLEGELSEAKRVQENLSRDLKLMQQNKFEMERHLEALVLEKDALARQLADALKPEQVRELEHKHKDELDRLQKKIKWYAENQELLDKSSAKLRAKEDEIHRLKMRLEDVKSEAGMKLEENKIRLKEKAADAKKVQDLERQVKEMEQVIRRRHPNSLPALMMVAASLPDSVGDGSHAKSRAVQVLESQVKKMQKELESKDELAQQDLRAMEQKYNHVKLQFEERIADLEKQLSFYTKWDGGVISKEHPHSHSIALERELNNVRDRCKKQVLEMQAEVERVTAELNKVKKNQENIMRNESRETEADWRQQVVGLQKELNDRDHDIQILQHTVDKMRARNSKRDNSSTKVNAVTLSAKRDYEPRAFADGTSTKRDYEPGAFADGDLSAVLLENQHLKTQVDQLQLELDQQRVDLRRSLAETESVARQNREQLEHQIDVLRSSHQKEIQKILTEQALHSSSSRVAELQSKCDTQEVMINHLQAQLRKVTREAEQLSHLKAKETQLQRQIDDLQERLKQAKMGQAPEMRHFESLEEKLTDLVQRQRKRETELDLVVKQNQQTCRVDLEDEIEKWKQVVVAKNQKLQVFRAELDSILEVLKTLQRQGVTLPVGTLYSQ